MTTLMSLAHELADEHFSIEEHLVRVAVFSQEGDSVLRLVEVNDATLPTGAVEPFLFARSTRCPVPVYIADVTSDEWERLAGGNLRLPAGWPERPVQVWERAGVAAK